MDGWDRMDGWLSKVIGSLRAPSVLINQDRGVELDIALHCTVPDITNLMNFHKLSIAGSGSEIDQIRREMPCWLFNRGSGA